MEGNCGASNVVNSCENLHDNIYAITEGKSQNQLHVIRRCKDLISARASPVVTRAGFFHRGQFANRLCMDYCPVS